MKLTQRPAYIVTGLRTPIGRYGGALARCRPDDLAAHVIRELVSATGTPAEAIDEVVLGCANQAGEDNRNVARMAILLAGLPESVPGVTVNRLCASGLDAVTHGARIIMTGEADVVIAGGVESMSRAPFVMPKGEFAFDRKAEVFDTTIGWRFVNQVMSAKFGVESMPETAENVAELDSISREDQDMFALRSQERTEAAVRRGRLAQEIRPILVRDRKGTIIVTEDEHPRKTTLEQLAALPTPFRSGGTVTAGNSSGINDGAAAVLLASAEAVARYEWEPWARFAGSASAGVSPAVMGIGPVPAVQRVLERHGVGLESLDAIELNEAFASQALACLRRLGLGDDDPRVNSNGGAIALGHPLGMTGTRLALTAALELHLTGGEKALTTLCVGVGQGVASLWTRP